MLPPVDHNVLQDNPEFAVLYSKLTTSVLNPDGSTKNGPATKDHRAATEALNEYRLQAAKQHLLTHAISTVNPHSLQTQHVPVPSLSKRPRPQPQVPSTPADLPSSFLDLLLLLPPLLETPSDKSSEAAALLLTNPPLSDLPTHLPQLARLVSSSLHSSAMHLARIANPTTNPSYVHRSIPALPTYAASLASMVADRKAELTRARLLVATQLTALLQEQVGVLTQLLRVLEAKHGPIARSVEFRATEAALTAQRQEAEAETTLWLARRDTYTPEATRALTNYANHLRDAKGRLNEAIRSLKTELEAYGVDESDGETGGATGGKEKIMREMARVYRDINRQMEEARADLERLGRA
ncbi:hypothetical protein C7999DRAFT_34555 [Corynascus novoguineensis]|uniref:Uncharacterized protein n=1 Tax=Corynascus novoguineensis TaxID=1126955 RepID=A0AAN7CN20_9PEZI|nr:hypothetical protein C7999DRAFT_34555 [Corynascus novoguineensis]